jgi:hypothetical protein
MLIRQEEQLLMQLKEQAHNQVDLPHHHSEAMWIKGK